MERFNSLHKYFSSFKEKERKKQRERLAVFLGKEEVTIRAYANGIRNIPFEVALSIEKYTAGEVTAKQLRPDLIEILNYKPTKRLVHE
ncbi:YdaS family helix-turn-helix protein [Shewanella surugensis]|uniref:Helix-turn-helix domain-containing protein n=1 Tax=Shewanella surugensis TaxID=212020 RepID=A0ABT0L922_9GAMM|nr:YdaS family helix-turn-helix protein [Shewanella surugensis]MCL1124130.1 helix-turn-helix domain-containing protein [Shewanella surugensis]